MTSGCARLTKLLSATLRISQLMTSDSWNWLEEFTHLSWDKNSSELRILHWMDSSQLQEIGRWPARSKKGMETSSSSVDARKTSNYKKGKSTQWEEKVKSKEEQSQSKEACGYYGRSKHPRADCPAKEKECNKCGKVGHFGNVCRSKLSICSPHQRIS